MPPVFQECRAVILSKADIARLWLDEARYVRLTERGEPVAATYNMQHRCVTLRDIDPKTTRKSVTIGYTYKVAMRDAFFIVRQGKSSLAFYRQLAEVHGIVCEHGAVPPLSARDAQSVRIFFNPWEAPYFSMAGENRPLRGAGHMTLSRREGIVALNPVFG
jgi:hypothetical protein